MGAEPVSERDATAVFGEVTRYVDPDALTPVFRLLPDGPARDGVGRIELQIDGNEITIYSCREIRVRTAGDAPSA